MRRVHQAPILHPDHPAGALCDVGIVRDDDDRPAALHRELKQEVDDFRARLGVEVSRRLVGEQHVRLVRESTRDCHTLLLASGELARDMVGAGCEPDGIEQRENTATSRLYTVRRERRLTGDLPDDEPLRPAERTNKPLRERRQPTMTGARRSRSVIRVPPPAARSATTSPPWVSATWRTIASPRPDPGMPRADRAR